MLTLSPHNPRLEALLDDLPDGLRRHAATVREIALELAGIHGVDPAKAELASAAHDIARAMKEGELRDRARAYGLDVHPVDDKVPVLLHGPVGAEILRRECGIEDVEILEAVHWHSTFNRGLGPVAKIAFLADKLDEHKAGRYPFQEKVHDLSKENLDAAVISFIQEEIASLLKANQLIHPASIEGINYLLESSARSSTRS